MNGPDVPLHGLMFPIMKLTMMPLNGQFTRDGFDIALYEHEKIIGKRSPTGELRLKKLRAWQKKILALHCAGVSNRDIAVLMNKAEITVSKITRDPLAQPYINGILDGINKEIAMLLPAAVDTIRQAMQNGDHNVALSAADKVFKATGQYTKGEKGGETAEDVIARALAKIAEDNHDELRELRSKPAQIVDASRVSDAKFEELP